MMARRPLQRAQQVLTMLPISDAKSAEDTLSAQCHRRAGETPPSLRPPKSCNAAATLGRSNDPSKRGEIRNARKRAEPDVIILWHLLTIA